MITALFNNRLGRKIIGRATISVARRNKDKELMKTGVYLYTGVIYLAVPRKYEV